MEEGEGEEDIDINIEIPTNILKDILDNSYKWKADGSIDYCQCKAHVSAHGRYCDTAGRTPGEDPRDVEGDRQAKLEEYYNWGLVQVESDRWRSALQITNQVIIDQFLELNTILQYPKVTTELIVKNRIKPDIIL